MNDIKIEGLNLPEDFTIPYKNRWGHWVWRPVYINEDHNWPGLKPPSPTVVPIFKEGVWYWH
jgi:hypothetical protein